MDSSIIPQGNVALNQKTDLRDLMSMIRPAWQAKGLIERTKRLMQVDPSSACQRIFNAAIHDLREKIVIAGLDIAKQAAVQGRLPPVERSEDVERYTPARLIDLAFGMGLLSRPEYRKMTRVYDIRGDLEHEDDEYEAGIEDCIYIFKTCIEVVFSRDPVALIRVQDVKAIVEQPGPTTLSHEIIEDFSGAPQIRQQEITFFLVSTALDDRQPDIVRRNAVLAIQKVEPVTQNAAKLEIANHLQSRLDRKPMDDVFAKLAQSSGVLAYIKTSSRTQFFEAILGEMKRIGTRWQAHEEHGVLLRDLKEVGGLTHVPAAVRKPMLQWLVLTYIGEPGGYGTLGRNRRVFFSDVAAPLVADLIRDSAGLVKQDLIDCQNSKQIKTAMGDEYVARRFEKLLDLVEET